ncbi:hypothetical protein SLE2022_108660 [Rubroshorea leprosula]
MAQKLVSFLTFIFLCTPVFSQEHLFFNGFNSAGDSMSLNGAAEIEDNGIIRLTNATYRVLGRAFYSSPIKFKNSTNGKAFSFSTAFAFAMVPQHPLFGGHGLAFTISPSKDLAGALPNQYLGLFNASSNGNFKDHIFAVEFDTVQDLDFQDIDANHVGIDLNGLVSKTSATAGYFLENSTKQELKLTSGKVFQAWIDYDSVKNRLDVKLSPFSEKPNSSLLSFDVDLSSILLDTMYVGFSSSTGQLSSSHYLLGWSFNMSGGARSLSLPALPSLPRHKKDHTLLIVLPSLSLAFLIISAIAVSIYIIRKIKNTDKIEAWELDVGPHRFAYEELKKATAGFRDKELLGFGGFGRVYKGTLPSTNTQVAVKRISPESKQGMREFMTEINSIGKLRHRNLVQLLGWCRRRADLLLVYDFMPNGSLDKHLFDEPKNVLSWEQRFKIIKDVASGLLYLHEEWEQTVIHRDIKAGNVLLDSELNGKLGDFGLAKLYERGANPSTTRVVGTLGYLAPELTRTGKPNTSSDVFAFGALLLEVVCGRRPNEPKALPEELILLDWVWEMWQSGAVLEVVDKKLNGKFDELEAVTVVKLGLMCSNNVPEARPTMRQAVMYLEGDLALPEEIETPGGYEVTKGSARSGTSFDDYVHSYRVSSYFEQVNTGSYACDDKDLDVEAGSTMSPISLIVSDSGDVR